MGPHFFKCGKNAKEDWGGGISGLQWGRTFSSAEKSPTRAGKALLFEASMGPHFFKCGKFFGRNRRSAVRIASMGPHFFKCGKSFVESFPDLLKACFNGAALFQVRKTVILSCLSLCLFSFNGAALFQVRKNSGFEQFGVDGSRFNGAALFQVRKNHLPGLARLFYLKLQWGRTFSSAETTFTAPSMERSASSFNGAALFQVRKHVSTELLDEPFDEASMGPHFFKCGNSTFMKYRLRNAFASMGPHFFKCGNTN